MQRETFFFNPSLSFKQNSGKFCLDTRKPRIISQSGELSLGINAPQICDLVRTIPALVCKQHFHHSDSSYFIANLFSLSGDKCAQLPRWVLRTAFKQITHHTKHPLKFRYFFATDFTKRAKAKAEQNIGIVSTNEMRGTILPFSQWECRVCVALVTSQVGESRSAVYRAWGQLHSALHDSCRSTLVPVSLSVRQTQPSHPPPTNLLSRAKTLSGWEK